MKINNENFKNTKIHLSFYLKNKTNKRNKKKNFFFLFEKKNVFN